MPFQKVCQYVPCSAAFVARGRTAKYCSISCGSKATALETPTEVKDYLLSNIQMPEDPDGCWIWIGSLNDAGYGMAFVRRGKVRAHRLTYETFMGTIPPYMHILHGMTCRTRACVNPEHVRIGTNLDNVRDRQAWGNEQRGGVHYATEISETQVVHILQEFHAKGLTMSMIAKKRHMSIVTVHDIVYRKTWAHVCPGLYPPPADQRAIVTPELVREMRRLHEDEGWTEDALRTTFNLSRYVVSDICKYATWMNVPKVAPPENIAPPEPPHPITEADVRGMRQAYRDVSVQAAAKGMRVKITRFAEPYARRHGSTNMAIRLILKGQTWKHVTP